MTDRQEIVIDSVASGLDQQGEREQNLPLVQLRGAANRKDRKAWFEGDGLVEWVKQGDEGKGFGGGRVERDQNVAPLPNRFRVCGGL